MPEWYIGINFEKLKFRLLCLQEAILKVNKMASKRTTALLVAFGKGYRIIDGVLFHNKEPLRGWVDINGYKSFGIKINGKMVGVSYHRLLAYQKHGNALFKPGFVVRHLDGNKLNNLDYNITIGTHKDNALDKPIEMRNRLAINASKHVKIHDHLSIIELHKKGYSYRQLMEMFNISSKGTISYIINKSIDI